MREIITADVALSRRALARSQSHAAPLSQGIGAGNQAAQARALAYAAGRFGHIIHPEVANEASVAAARALLDTINPPDRSQSRLTRVFWSDDGSTAIEVALKMAFRAFDRRRPLPGTSSDGRAPGSAKVEGAPQADLGLVPASEGAASVAPQRELHVVALSGGYHGDTLGAMDATEPSTFTDSQTPWYSPKGLFLAPPVVALRGGRWTAQLPGALAEAVGERLDRDLVFLTREAAFCPARRNSELARVYRSHIEDALDTHESRSGATVGALLMEPILQGAGGMRLVDPLFQWVLADVCRGRSIPVVADEVFTGLFRLGSATACAMVSP